MADRKPPRTVFGFLWGEELTAEKYNTMSEEKVNETLPYLTRRAILINRVHKLNIIRNDIYPKNFNRATRLIIGTEKKLSIIDKLLGW